MGLRYRHVRAVLLLINTQIAQIVGIIVLAPTLLPMETNTSSDYLGVWKFGKYHGQGILDYRSGSVIKEGIWKYGSFQYAQKPPVLQNDCKTRLFSALHSKNFPKKTADNFKQISKI